LRGAFFYGKDAGVFGDVRFAIDCNYPLQILISRVGGRDAEFSGTEAGASSGKG